MNRICLLHYESPTWGTRPRILVLAVLAALPGVIHAQTTSPLQIDSGLLERGVSQSQPSAAQSQPVSRHPSVGQSLPSDDSRRASPTVLPPAKNSAIRIFDTPAVKTVQNTTAPSRKGFARGVEARKIVSDGKRATVVVVPKADPGSPRDESRVTTVDAERIDGHDQVDMTAMGAVKLVRGNTVLTSDQLYYDQQANDATAEGNVQLEHGDDGLAGPKARVNLDTWYGEFYSPTYRLKRERKLTLDSWPTPGTPLGPSTMLVTVTGKADLLTLIGENQYRLTNSTYTTCKAPNPTWYLRMHDLKLDFDRDKGEARNSVMVFKDVPVFYMPWAEFPLSGGRQSGVLAPTIGAGNLTGIDTLVPYYLNLAPNYDATLYPRYMSTRGMQMGGEFRYLTSQSSGVMRGEYLDEDLVTHTSRSLTYWKDQTNFGSGWSGSVDAEHVSDKTYFADLSSKIASTSQSTLNQQASLAYSSGTWLSGTLTVQRYQTLSGSTPYSRLPQLGVTAQKNDFHGLDFSLPVEYTDFSSSTQDAGRRLWANPQVSLPMQSSAFFLTPKAQFHVMQYDLTRRTTTGDSNITKVIPTVSVDSGVVFERDTTVGGKDQINTLEPRVYYVRTPYRDQSQIPIFDTSVADFNFGQIFSENRYVGKDRVVDANQLTAGVQSRMIEASTGEEWLRGALAQRYYFENQQTVIPGETPRTGRVADVLASLSGRVTKKIWVDNSLEYEPTNGRWQRAATDLRYQAERSKVVSVGYRYYAGSYRDIDLSAQWPLWGGFYGVGRYELNLRDHRLSEGIAGVEYKGDCWVLRTVWQTLVTSSTTRSNSFYVQMEFSGLASAGSSPVNLLKRSVSGYGKISSLSGDDSMFDGSDNE